MKRFIKHGIAIIGIAALVFLAVGSAASTPSANAEAVEFNKKGYESSEKGDYDQAIVYYDKAIELDPKYASAYNNRAWIYAYHLKRDFDRAISDANQAIKLAPNNANYFDTRGWAYLGNGDYEKAVADFEKALQINSNLESSIEGLAQARQGLTRAQLAQIVPQLAKDEDFEVKQNADNTITITGYKGTLRSVIIPDTLYGLKVTIIGNSAFRNKGLISVVIPDTVTTIENGRILEVGHWTNGYLGAFSKNEELIKVTLGKGIKTIGDLAFSENSQLTEINIPDSVIRIGDYSFNPSSSAGLIKVTLGTGLQTIGRYAFAGNQIAEINFPSSLKEIGVHAFRSNKIQKVTLGTGLQTIGEYAFQNNQITEISFPSSLKEIQGGAFANNQIQSITIPNSITSIYSAQEATIAELWYVGAFENNPLTTVVIPASLVNGRISRQAFGKINGNTIVRITIPVGMKEDTLKGIFEDTFINFWINQNRAGGTYVKRGPIWTKE